MALQLTQDLRRITVHRRVEELVSLADAGKHEPENAVLDPYRPGAITALIRAGSTFGFRSKVVSPLISCSTSVSCV